MVSIALIRFVHRSEGSRAIWGLTSTGRNWYRTTDEAVTAVGLQKSQYSNKFYLNIGVLIRALDSTQYPTPTNCHIMFRAGELFPSSANMLATALDFDDELDEVSRIASVREIMVDEFVPGHASSSRWMTSSKSQTSRDSATRVGFPGRFWIAMLFTPILAAALATQVVDLFQFALPNHGLGAFNYLPEAFGWGLLFGIGAAAFGIILIAIASRGRRRPIAIQLLLTTVAAFVGTAASLYGGSIVMAGRYFPLVPIVVAVGFAVVVTVANISQSRN